LLLAVGGAGLVVLLVGALRRRSEAWRSVLVASWLVVPFVLALAISYFKPMLLDRYLIVSVPALALAGAYAISRLGRWAGAVALVALVVVGLTHVRDWYGSVVEQEWRGAVHYVEREKLASDQLLVYPGWLGDPVIYYASSAVDTSELPTGDRAWVITLTERAPEVEQWVAGAGYEVAERTNFVSVDVWRVAKPDGG